MSLVVDASVGVEYLLKTPIGIRVASTLEGAALLAPELFDAEVVAVLRREVLRGDLEEARAAEAVDDLCAWDVERVPHRGLLRDVWALRHDVSAYDALYVAVARLYGAALVTADGPLARVPSRAGVVVQNVRLA